MSADGDIVREAICHQPSATKHAHDCLGCDALAALARLEAAAERRPLDLAQRIAELEAINRQMSAAEGPQRLAAAEAQRDTLAEALRRIKHYPFDVVSDEERDSAGMRELARAALAEAGL